MKIKINDAIMLVWFVVGVILLGILISLWIEAPVEYTLVLCKVIMTVLSAASMLALYDVFFVWVEPAYKFPHWQTIVATCISVATVLSTLVATWLLDDPLLSIIVIFTGELVIFPFGRLCCIHSKRVYDASHKHE